MANNSPSVKDLNKSESDTDEEPSDDAKSAVAEEAGENYPDDLESDSDDSDGSQDDSETQEKSEEEEKTLKEKLGLSFKIDHEDEFTDVREGDTVLIDTPIEGTKVGKVVDRTETWTGITQATVDTGASEYSVTPFDDEFSSKFVATVDEKLELSEDILRQLEPAKINDVSTGDSVVLDCPEIGPTQATTTDVVESKNQGLRATFKAGECYFVVYEEPTPVQAKEAPYIVGRMRE